LIERDNGCPGSLFNAPSANIKNSRPNIGIAFSVAFTNRLYQNQQQKRHQPRSHFGFQPFMNTTQAELGLRHQNAT